MRTLCMITHKHVFVFKNCDRYDYDYDYEMNLLRHKYMWINIMLYEQLYSHILKMWYVT